MVKRKVLPSPFSLSTVRVSPIQLQDPKYGVLLPVRTGNVAGDLAVGLAAMAMLGVATGCVESTKARVRLTVVPQLLVAATVLAGIGFVLTLG